MRAATDKYVRLVIVSFCLVAALSACGGGGMRVQEPEPPTPVPLPLPIGHGLVPGEIPVPAGGSAEHGNVVFYCPAGGEACMVTVADGTASYASTGGVPTVAYPPARRMTEALNAYAPFARRNVAGRVARTAVTAVASSTASTTDKRPLVGGAWNTGVTQAPANSDPDSLTDNRAIHAWYLDGRVVFERITFGLDFRHNTRTNPSPPGYLAGVSLPPGAGAWQGVEHFFISTGGGRYYSVFYSDIEDNLDTDYLALGYWAWIPGPGVDRRPFVGATASGNDPFLVNHITAVSGQATYSGAATGLYVEAGAPPAFQAFHADVRLTADFDANSVSGAITAGRHASTGATLFDDLMLGIADIRTTDAAFFRGRVSGMLDGRPAAGSWGGQFYGNGLASTDIPVSFAEAPGSVAGTFGARVLDGDSLLGVFGAHRDSGETEE